MTLMSAPSPTKIAVRTSAASSWTKKEWKGSVLEYLASVEDPRVARTRAHPLENILVIALLAVICGAESFVDMQKFGESKREFLEDLLDLSSGIPSHDTFGRVLAMLNPSSLEAAFREWTAVLVQASIPARLPSVDPSAVIVGAKFAGLVKWAAQDFAENLRQCVAEMKVGQPEAGPLPVHE